MRYGRTRTVVTIICISPALAIVIEKSIGISTPLLILLVVVHGCFVTGDSASITTGVIESSNEDNHGVTMAVHSSIGFISFFLGSNGFGIVLNCYLGHNS